MRRSVACMGNSAVEPVSMAKCSGNGQPPVSLHSRATLTLELLTASCSASSRVKARSAAFSSCSWPCVRSEELTSELQSRGQLVCRLLLEKKKNYSKVQQ